jgi:hypothetical protein
MKKKMIPAAWGLEGGHDRDQPSDEESRTGYGVLTADRDPSKLTVARTPNIHFAFINHGL